MNFLVFYTTVSLLVGLFLVVLSQEDYNRSTMDFDYIISAIVTALVTAVIWPLFAISFMFGVRWEN